MHAFWHVTNLPYLVCSYVASIIVVCKVTDEDVPEWDAVFTSGRPFRLRALPLWRPTRDKTWLDKTVVVSGNNG